MIVPLFALFRPARAALLDQRSVTLSTAEPGVSHTEVVQFLVKSSSNLGSISFEYCDNSPLPQIACTAPPGFSLASAVLSAQTGNTGFAIDVLDSTANRLVLTRPSSPGSTVLTAFTLTNVMQSSLQNSTLYLRVATYASTDGTGALTDNGSMAFATQTAAGFRVGAYVPPFLIFCVGVTVAPQCTSATGLLLSFGELSTSSTKTATSQFSGATNDPTGYSVFINGHTMTAGNQAIPALSSNAPSAVGTSQFGINLRGNTVPGVGADQTGVGTSAIAASYNTPNSFRFNDGDLLTSSNLSTDYNITTVSYIVNVSSSQQPGYYATTMTYTAVASF